MTKTSREIKAPHDSFLLPVDIKSSLTSQNIWVLPLQLMSNTISESLRRNQQCYNLMSKVQSNFALTQTVCVIRCIFVSVRLYNFEFLQPYI